MLEAMILDKLSKVKVQGTLYNEHHIEQNFILYVLIEVVTIKSDSLVILIKQTINN